MKNNAKIPSYFKNYLCLLLSCFLLLASCDLTKQLGKNLSSGAVDGLDSTKLKSLAKNLSSGAMDGLDTTELKSLAKNLSSGLVEGLDTTELKSLTKSLSGIIANELNESIDSINVQKLGEDLEKLLSNVVEQGGLTLEDILANPTLLDQIGDDIADIINEATDDLDKVPKELIQNILSEKGQATLFAFRDSLLGAKTKVLLQELVSSSIDSLTANPNLDSLIVKIQNLVTNSTEDIDRTVVLIGSIIVGILLLALLVTLIILWRRNRTQKKLLVNLTKAIDAIPSQTDYDKTIDALQRLITDEPETIAQNNLLVSILKEYESHYTNKKRHKNHMQRFIKSLQKVDGNGNIRQQILQGAKEDDYQAFVQNIFQTQINPTE